MRWAILLLAAALASGAGAFCWTTHQQLVGMQAALREAQAGVNKLQAAYAALQAAYDVRAKAYEQADRQALDRLATLDQQAGDWGDVCLPVGIGGMFCAGANSAGANSDASGEPHAGNGGSGLDAKNK